MWIRRLAVENWRGLTASLEDLAPGLNLVAGPNESGKSRLVEALRFALFESSSGQAAHKKALATWGVAADKPRVVVEFELGGSDWRLEKVFLGTGHNAHLRSADEHHEDEAAEARLADLLGVAGGSGRTEVKLEDRGVWSLLWVEQGDSSQRPAHNDESQSRILNQLTEEIGEVAAGEFGQQMLGRAEAYRARYFTPKSGAGKDTLATPRRTVQELEERLAHAVARRSELAQAADDLERSRQKAQELSSRHQAAAAELETITAQHHEAEKLRHELEVADERVGAAETARQDARDKLENAERHLAEQKDLAARIEEGSKRLQRDQAAADKLRKAFEDASRDLAGLESRIDNADSHLRLLRRRQQLTAQRDALERANSRLQTGRALAQRQSDIRTELAGMPNITPRQVTELRRLLEARATARAQLDGASVSLTLTAHRDLQIDGEPLAAGASRRLLADDDRRIEVEALLAIDVQPGAGDVVALRDRSREAERRVAECLDTLGVADADEADRIAQRRGELERELKRQSESLAERVPEGLEELERVVGELEAGIEAAAGDDSESMAFDPAELATAEAELRSLAERRSAARARRDGASEQLNAARETLAGLRAKVESDQAQHDQISRRLATMPGTDKLKDAAEAAERAFGERVAARDETRRRFQASGGERASEDLERARKAEAQLSQQLADTRESCIRLETVLSAAGDDGRHEQVQELEAELEQARTALARVERDAAAAWRLHEVLDREYKAARERLSRPVVERIRPYLEDLFPGSEVWLDEDLELKGLRSDLADEGFEFLSGGAREQLSLLVRLGLAEVLGAEEPWPLVLDDVLVNTDAERIRRMQRALFHAGRRMQILLFTCHGPLFDTLGPDTHIELPIPSSRQAGSDGAAAR
ncbi:MAG: AAA family ATPase [Gammaproteobacteria bacterium]|nr:AAA family ATPase [Gammaproteobacteria bacterium]